MAYTGIFRLRLGVLRTVRVWRSIQILVRVNDQFVVIITAYYLQKHAQQRRMSILQAVFDSVRMIIHRLRPV
jgi:hypothetical protein